MFKQKRRGPLAAELGKSVGGALSLLGTLVAVKASQELSAVPVRPGVVRLFSYGDLYTPFTVPTVALWVGMGIASTGVVLRLLGYIHIWKDKK